MGDARSVVQMREDDNKDKQDKATPAAEPARAPVEAVKDPGAALEHASGVDLSGFAESLLTSLQEAGGNLAVQNELVGLEEGVFAASKAAQDKAAFETMSDTEKIAYSVNKNGGKLPEPTGRKAPAPGEPAPGMDPPTSVVSFHNQRAAEMMQLSGVYTQMTAQAAAMAANPAIDEATRAAFTLAVGQYTQMGAEYMAASARYSAVAADMATNEFAGIAVPPSTVGPVYQARLASLMQQQATLQQAAAAQIAQVGESQLEAAQLQAQKAALVERRAALAAQAAEGAQGGGGDGGDGGGGGGDAPDMGAQMAKLDAQRASLDARTEATNSRAQAAQTVSTALSTSAAQLNTLIGAYNGLLASSAGTPTGKPSGGK